MLRRLIIALLVCAALLASVRPGMAVVAEPGSQAPGSQEQAAAMDMAHHHMAAHCDDENAAGNHPSPASRGCPAMSGCFPPAIGSDLVHVVRISAGVRWSPWRVPAEDFVPVTVAPDLRPPRAFL